MIDLFGPISRNLWLSKQAKRNMDSAGCLPPPESRRGGERMLYDLFGQKRIAELEARLEVMREDRDSWKEFSWLYIDEVAILRARLRDILDETCLGKSGTAQKIARMAGKALEVHGGD